MTTIEKIEPTFPVQHEPRTKVARYTFEDTRKDNTYGESQVSALEVWVTHDKERKRFRVSFNRVIVGDRFVHMAIRFGQGQPVSDYAVPVARYSDKARDEAFRFALMHTEESWPELAEWARRAVEEDDD